MSVISYIRVPGGEVWHTLRYPIHDDDSNIGGTQKTLCGRDLHTYGRMAESPRQGVHCVVCRKREGL